MAIQGYKRIKVYHCVCIHQFLSGNFIILLLYIDEMLIVGKDSNMICRLKEELSKSFHMKDLGPTR